MNDDLLLDQLESAYTHYANMQATDPKVWHAMKQLKMLLLDDAHFRMRVDNALTNAQPMSGGWALSPLACEQAEGKLWIWTQKSIVDFFSFFAEFLTNIPTPENSVAFYQCIYSLFPKNPSASVLFCEGKGLQWSKQFILARGRFMDSPASWSNSYEQLWRSYMGEVAWARFVVPEGGFISYNDFFTRELKLHSIPSEPKNEQYLSPCDGIVNIVNQNLGPQSLLGTKYDVTLDLRTLLYGSTYVESFYGGTATSTVLLPTDYHHIHSPVSGTVVETQVVDRDCGVVFGMDGEFEAFYNSENVGGYKTHYGEFGVYHRLYIIIDSQNYGKVAVVAIGLDDVNSIVFKEGQKCTEINSNRPYPVGTKIEAGQKLGCFQYGGSTVLTLFQKGVFPSIRVQQGAPLGALNYI